MVKIIKADQFAPSDPITTSDSVSQSTIKSDSESPIDSDSGVNLESSAENLAEGTQELQSESPEGLGASSTSGSSGPISSETEVKEDPAPNEPTTAEADFSEVVDEDSEVATDLANESSLAKTISAPKFNFRKILMIGLPVILLSSTLIGGILFLNNRKNSAQSKNDLSFIETNYHTLVQEAEKVARDERLGYTKSEDLTALAKSYNNFGLASKDIQFNADKNTGITSSIKAELSTLLANAQTFATDADTTITSASKDLLSLDANSYKSLNSSSTVFKSNLSDFATKYGLKETVSTDIFSLPAYLNEAKALTQKAKDDADQAAKKLSEEEATKVKAQAEEQAAVNAIAKSYLQGYINLNEAAVRNTLTSNYINEYPYDNLKAPITDSYKPVDFRIVSVTKTTEGQYQVQANVTYLSIYQNATNGQVTQNKATNTENYKLIYVDGLKSWRIDNITRN